MRVRILIATVVCLFPAYACCQTGAGPSADSAAIHFLLGQYAKAVDTVDLKLLAQIWSHSPDVSFIYLHRALHCRTQCGYQRWLVNPGTFPEALRKAY
jgi:hypothetical protein